MVFIQYVYCKYKSWRVKAMIIPVIRGDYTGRVERHPNCLCGMWISHGIKFDLCPVQCNCYYQLTLSPITTYKFRNLNRQPQVSLVCELWME